jgi:hypothetical protein
VRFTGDFLLVLDGHWIGILIDCTTRCYHNIVWSPLTLSRLIGSVRAKVLSLTAASWMVRLLYFCDDFTVSRHLYTLFTKSLTKTESGNMLGTVFAFPQAVEPPFDVFSAISPN